MSICKIIINDKVTRFKYVKHPSLLVSSTPIMSSVYEIVKDAAYLGPVVIQQIYSKDMPDLFTEDNFPINNYDYFVKFHFIKCDKCRTVNILLEWFSDAGSSVDSNDDSRCIETTCRNSWKKINHILEDEKLFTLVLGITKSHI